MSVLAGVRVVELGIWVAGPAAGGMLADWGAEVIKVEPPRGDPMRQLFKALSGSEVAGCPPFDLYNRGKRSVAIDLKTSEGQEVMERLVGSADVFLSNLRPQYLKRIGLDPDTLRAKYPRLVYASLTGYGLEGPDRDAPGFDVAAFSARSGVADRCTPPGESPPILPGGMGDNVTALSMVSAILAALLSRERTGEGQLVSTSLLRNGVYAIGMEVSTRLGLGRVAPTPSRLTPQNPLMNPYKAGDGRWLWLIGAEAQRHWPGIVAALGAPELAEDERFATPKLRRRNARDLIARIDEILATRSRDEWAETFAEHEVWWAPVNGVDDLLDDPQVDAAGCFLDVEHGPSATGKAVAAPVDFGAAPASVAHAVPTVGQDTEAVLSEIGLEATAIGALREAGAI